MIVIDTIRKNSGDIQFTNVDRNDETICVTTLDTTWPSVSPSENKTKVK